MRKVIGHGGQFTVQDSGVVCSISLQRVCNRVMISLLVTASPLVERLSAVGQGTTGKYLNLYVSSLQRGRTGTNGGNHVTDCQNSTEYM